MSMTQKISSRSTGLDLARSIAILAVIWVHTTEIQSGGFGVQLFFMVSGYLLANFKEHYTKSEFIFNRAMRLFPLAILMTLLFLFRYESALEISLSLLLINGLFTGVNTFPGGWSISNEWIYSWGNLFLKINLRMKVVTLALLLLLGVVLDALTSHDGEILGKFHSMAYLFSYFAFFLAGNIFASVRFREKLSFLRLRRFLFLTTIPLFSISFYLPTIVYLLLLSALFLACLDQESYGGRLTTGVIHFIGKRTYGLFCGHFVVLIGLTNTNLDQVLTNWFGGFSNLMLFFIVFIGGLMLASLTYRFIEKPFISKSQQLISRSRNSR